VVVAVGLCEGEVALRPAIRGVNRGGSKAVKRKWGTRGEAGEGNAGEGNTVGRQQENILDDATP
jgi:hypothetical protein